MGVVRGSIPRESNFFVFPKLYILFSNENSYLRMPLFLSPGENPVRLSSISTLSADTSREKGARQRKQVPISQTIFPSQC